MSDQLTSKTIPQKELKLNSPAGSEFMSYSWPLQTGSGSDAHDGGVDIVDTIKWVCEDVPEIKAALENCKFNDIDTGCYESMSSLCERYNKAIDSVTALVKIKNKNINI